jgi:hypothetical protein
MTQRTALYRKLEQIHVFIAYVHACCEPAETILPLCTRAPKVIEFQSGRKVGNSATVYLIRAFANSE